ncbi:MAG: beta-glucosidase [Sphingomonadaceae bacterium]
MTSFTPVTGMTATAIEAMIGDILAEATLAEKVGMMSGKGFFKLYREGRGVWAAHPYRAGGGIERLGVPALYFTDGPRGVARGQSTCFPCSMARGASFDPDLEYRIGQIMGIEARAQGCSLSGAVCYNLLRHPAWGRAQETYGEDTHHLGMMGTALGLGIQSHNVAATVKHFALNSMENARFTVDVRIDERTLHEVYLPHFKRSVDAGIATVMSAYNKVNGEYAGQHRELLTTILRGEWGFDGFVHSDWVKGVYDVYGASAGLDVENPEPIIFGDKLIASVEAGTTEPQVIDVACRRILRVIYRFASAEDPLADYPLSLVAASEHIAVAREAAEKSAVLLTNEGVLPFDRGTVKTIAVLGKLAAMENTGDNGSSRVRPPYVVTALAGLQAYLGAAHIVTGDEDDLETARKAANAADAVVIVVGNTFQDEGEFIPGDIALGQAGSEASMPDDAKAALAARRPQTNSIGGDRTDLALRSEQIALIEAAVMSGKPVVVVIVSGSAILVEGWHDKVGAILQTFYSGMEGGTALARLLFGEVSPSGKLPFTVAKSAADYPFFDINASSITYGYYHGYTLMDKEQRAPRFAFGHGLSYASFAFRALKVRVAIDAIEVSVAVHNDGDCDGDEVVQVYIGVPGRAADRPFKSLKAFQRVPLAPGETAIVDLVIPIEDLAWRNPSTHSWEVESGTYAVMVGGNSVDLLTTTFVL